MVAQTVPVHRWGLEPCGDEVSPTQSRCSAGTVAARRTRRAPGAANSRSNVADQSPCSTGASNPAGGIKETQNEQKKSSPAAAPPVWLDVAF